MSIQNDKDNSRLTENNISDKENQETVQKPEVIEASPIENSELMPQMNIAVPAGRQNGDISTLVGDDALLGIYDEITKQLRKDREEIDGLMTNFADMVFNDGDASSASKEAVVSLMKMKTDTADKMTKVADLMTRLKMKEKDTMSSFQKSQYNQTNNVTIQTNKSKRDLIEQIEKDKRNGNS